MRRVLGIDTSNYTTSCALWEDGRVVQKKRLLPVREGQLGLRQSDAVFHHTQQLPPLLRGQGLHTGIVVQIQQKALLVFLRQGDHSFHISPLPERLLHGSLQHPGKSCRILPLWLWL